MHADHHRVSPGHVLVGLLPLLVATVVSAWGSTPAFADCSQADRNSGECRSIDAEVGGDAVTVRVEQSSPGSPGSSGGESSSTQSSGNGQGAASQSSGPESTPSPPPRRQSTPSPPRSPVLGSGECEIKVVGLCRASAPPKNPPPSPDETVRVVAPSPPTPPRSASDLGSFVPEQPSGYAEPGEWSMPRLPTNFVTRASVHTVKGELLGWPVEVRFTPVAYHWTFGDGQRSSFSQPGRSWSSLGLRQFQPTPTSHVYARPGRYSVSVRVEYRAEFRFVGESFQRLSGTVSSSGRGFTLEVLTVSPLLLG